MFGPSIGQLLDDYLRELALHKGDPEYSATNIAGAVAQTFGGAKPGPETIRGKNKLLEAFVAELARRVELKDTEPGIDQDDIAEEVVRDSGVPDREILDFARKVTVFLRKPAPREYAAPTFRRKVPRYTDQELEALRIMKERGDHLLSEDSAT